jgi:hypothetical protein
MLEQVVANYSAAGLPLEGLWVDIEVMANRFKVFTFDEGACCGLGRAARGARAAGSTPLSRQH